MAIGRLLEKLFVAVGADLSELIKESDRASKEVSRSTGQITKMFTGLGKGITQVGKATTKAGAAMTAGITAPLLASVPLMIKAWDGQEKAIAQVESALESTGGTAGRTLEQLSAQASALQGSTLFGDEDILENVTANMLTFTKVHGEVFDRAQQVVLDYSTRLKVDLKSAAVQVGKALNDPVKGISALSRSGVQFTESQKDVIKALVKSGDTAKAQALILAELETQFAGAARAAAEAGTGPFKQMQMAIGDLMEVGGGLIIELLPGIISLVKDLTKWLQGLDKEQVKWGLTLGAIAAAAGPVIVVVGSLITAIGSLITVLPIVAGGIKGIVAALAVLGGPITLAVAAIAALATGYVLFKDEVHAAVSAVVSFVTAQFATLGEGFSRMVSQSVDLASQFVDGVKTWFVDRFNEIVNSVLQKVQWIGDKFKWLYDSVVGNSWVPDMVDEIGIQFGRLDSQMVRPAQQAADDVGRVFSGLGNVLGGHLRDFLETGKIDIRRFVQDIGDRILDNALKSFSDSLNDLLKSFMSNLFRGIGSSFGGSVSGGGGLFGGLGNLLSNIFSFRALGGVEMPWRRMIAGENGAELIEQDGAAGARRVFTAGRTRHMMSGGGMGGANIRQIVVNGARGNAEIREMVSIGVQEGIATYDRRVGDRVSKNIGRRG